MEETRGRPRNEAFDQIALDVATWHQANSYREIDKSQVGSVSVGPIQNVAKAANAFRNSLAYRELRELYGEIFAIRVNKKTCCFLVGYREDGDKT
jgi:hypothetical protein